MIALTATALAAALSFAAGLSREKAAPMEVPREEIIEQVAKDFKLSRAQVEQEPWCMILDHDNWYHRSRVMKWPAFGQSATRTVAATGVDDDIAIQKAIDTLPASGGKVVLLPGTFVLGTAIRPKNNTELEIRGTLKVADAVRSELTADVTAGTTTLRVADASRFRVGQWVTVCEDNPKLDHKGGRRYGESVTVKSIAGNTLTVSAPLGKLYANAKWQVAGYAVARKAFVTTSHSAIVAEGVQRVYIHGGEIDGNRARQSATAPLATDEVVEDLRANCGIGVVHSSWVKVENVQLRNANLHNIAFYKSDHCEAAGLESSGCNDKNICILEVETLRLINNYCHDSVLEDGICCHAPGGPYILIANNRATGHKRYGIHVGYSSPHALLARNVAQSNHHDFLINITNPRVPPVLVGKKLKRHDTVVFTADRRHRIKVTGEVLPWPDAADLAKEGVLFIENAAEPAPVEFTVKLETVMKHDDGKFLWFHPRAAAIPGQDGSEPSVVMTIQKHLKISDYYSGLHVMTRPSPAAPWTGPVLPPELDWRQQPDGVIVSVADVTPGWHAPTKKLLAIGCQVRYSPKGKQLDDVPRAHRTVYAVFDPKKDRWTPWQVLELPPGEEFNFARNACSQWLVRRNGLLLLPLYIGRNSKEPFSVTVAECRFDGAKLTCVRHGTVLRLNVVRGLCEPSLIAHHGRYFLTLRNDLRGYVTASDDGLQFPEQQPWLFDDGAELGSYNTQQHWLAHSDGLFLVYTRRGANNDHIVRHRAPLFMAQVCPATLRVLRRTEKVVVPERGAEMGNFGACPISETESWVTVSEGMFMKDSRQRGAEGATFVARVLWAKPNNLAPPK